MKIGFFQKIQLAFKAFFKAFQQPIETQQFLADITLHSTSDGEASHLRLLAILQQSGRLIDFLKEDLATYTDAQVGTAVRKIHQDCAQTIEELVTIRPIREENEGATIRISPGYDSTQIKIVGHVKGEPPYTGTLVHKGWKAHKRSLPHSHQSLQNQVICPAEIEVKT